MPSTHPESCSPSAQDRFCADLDRRLKYVQGKCSSPAGGRIVPNNPWWPFPCDGQSSSLEVHSYRVCNGFIEDERDAATSSLPTPRLQRGVSHTRLLSIPDLYRHENELPEQSSEERRRDKQWRAQLYGNENPTRSRVTKVQKLSSLRAVLRHHNVKRLTVYDGFSEDCFGKKLSPKPFERRKSQLAIELKHEKDEEEDCVAQMKAFAFPENGNPKRKHSSESFVQENRRDSGYDQRRSKSRIQSTFYDFSHEDDIIF
ncbi:hypothetical protein EJ08DRAFT_145217 [Tothia fuscella]|uniref:Uncharacterized protein n=1 Tax=Tothia fuscella TaxID=1048955 RepID=A0A9P4P4D4_9PEZI|nr:hypothetical protein EJ08DRAFT_145217 [Tothia fuscella]